MVAGIDETVRPTKKPAAYVQRLARSKAEKRCKRLDQGVVLGADTTVVIANQILGQPVTTRTREECLILLNGKMARRSDWCCGRRVGGETRVVAYETDTRAFCGDE